MLVLPLKSADLPACADHQSIAARQHAQSIRAEVRCQPESQGPSEHTNPQASPRLHDIPDLPGARPYLHGGEPCKALCRKYELTRDITIRRFQEHLLAALERCPAPVSNTRIAQLAEAKAKESTEFVVRRTQLPDLDYATMVAQLKSNPGASRRVGSFTTEGAAPNKLFSSFTKLNAQGIAIGKHMPGLYTADNNKIHLNLCKEDMPSAWQALRPLLLSADNPFIRWKTTLLDHVDTHYQRRLVSIAEREQNEETGFDADRARRDAATRRQRTTDGMQFTLYPFRPADDTTYRIFGPQFRHFLTLLDWELVDRNVRPGQAPESDVAIDGLRFSTFRNGHCGTRGPAYDEEPVTDETRRRQMKTAFYKAIMS